MRFFVTGATGFIGSAVVKERTSNGHEVLGLERSDKGKQAIKKVGAEVDYDSLEDLDSLRRGGGQKPPMAWPTSPLSMTSPSTRRTSTQTKGSLQR